MSQLHPRGKPLVTIINGRPIRSIDGVDLSNNTQRLNNPGGAIRHRKVLRDNIYGITKPAIRRLCRRGGVKRIAGGVYEEIRGVLKVFLKLVLEHSVVIARHPKGKYNRKTIKVDDVLYALKRNGNTIYV
jgi:histone H4